MKISIYSGSIPSSSFVENLMIELAKNGHKVFVFGKKHGKINPNTKCKNLMYRISPQNYVWGLIVVSFWLFFLAFYRFPMFYRLPDLFRQQGIIGLKQKYQFLLRVLPVLIVKPDIFHVQWIKTGHNWLFLQQFGVKVIASFRGAHINYSPVVDPKLADIYRNTFCKYNGFHAVSKAIAKEASQYYKQDVPLAVIPGAVNQMFLGEYPIVKTQEIGTSNFRILSVGRDHWVKGYSYALDACKILLDKGVNFRYTIIGGSKSEELIYQIDDLGLKDNVILSPAIPYKEMVNVYRESDLLLLSSVAEGIANVVLEAMAVGLPVITTACGGMEEVVKNKINGFVVPIRDPESIAKMVQQIKHMSIDEIVQIKESAHKTIEDNHQLKDQIIAMQEFYKEVLN